MAITNVYPYGQGGQAASGLGIVNDMVTGGVDKALSAEQGKILGGRTDMPMEKVVPSISGTLYPSNGNEWNIGGYWRTPYTRIDPNKSVYAMGDSNNSNVAFVAFYDDNLAFISSVSNIGNAGVEYEIQVPAGATIACSTCTTAQKSTAYLTQKVTKEVNDVSTESKTDLDVKFNLIDGVRISKGYLVDGILTSTLYYTSDYIRITDDMVLELTVIRSYFGIACDLISYYADRDDSTYLGGIQVPTGNKSLKSILTIPTGAKWVRLCGSSEATVRGYKLECRSIDYYKSMAEIQRDMRTPEPAKLLLPKYMDVVVNRQCDFWIDDYIHNPAGLPIRYTTPTDVSRFNDGHMRITASATGSVDMKLNTFYKADVDKLATNWNNYSVGSQEMTIRKVAKSGGSGTFNVLIIGDSLVEYSSGQNPRETYDLLAEDADVTINQIGTQTVTVNGKTYRHEGYGGKTWSWFCGSSSPFYFNGALSFSTYMSTNFPDLSGIDLCVIMLGTNDTASGVPGYVKTFLDALVADFPNCKVALGIPALGGKYAGYPTDFEDKIRCLANEYLKYDNGQKTGYENVTCVGQGCWIDRINDYPTTEDDMTPYSSAKFNKFDLGGTIHPKAQGYKQWGRAVYCKIRSWIAGNL